MTRTAKEDMKLDAKKASVCKRLVRELHISASESKKIVEGILAKYGDNGFEVINASMERPYDALGAIGEKGRTSRRTLKFFLDKNLTEEQLKKALGEGKFKTNAKVKKDMRDAAAQAKTGKRELPRNLAERQQNLDKRTKKTTKTNTGQQKKKDVLSDELYDWGQGRINITGSNPITPVWMDNKITADKKAQETYDKLVAGKVSGDLTFDELAKRAGVTRADLQALINKQPTVEAKGNLIASINPGKTRQAFAHQADKVRGACHGDCLSGVQRMAVGVYGSDAKSPINGMRKEWKTDVPRAKGDNANSACNAHVLFDNCGNGMTLTVPNLAYGERAGSQGNKRMKAFNQALPSGTVASTSHKRNAKGYAANQSALHGHIWVKDNKGNSCSDGVQKDGPKDFNAYGPDVYVTLFKDDYVPQELALDLIKQAQQRQEATQQKKQTRVAQR